MYSWGLEGELFSYFGCGSVQWGTHLRFHGPLIALRRPVVVINWPALPATTIATQESPSIVHLSSYLSIANENHPVNLIGLFSLLQNKDCSGSGLSPGSGLSSGFKIRIRIENKILPCEWAQTQYSADRRLPSLFWPHQRPGSQWLHSFKWKKGQNFGGTFGWQY